MKLMMDKGVIGFIEIQAILQSVKDEARQNNWTDLQTEMRYQEVLWSDRLSLREQIAGDEYDIGDTADIQAFIKIQRAFLDADYSRDKVTTEQYERESRFWERLENHRLAIQDVLALHKGIKSDEDDDFFSSCTCDEWDEYNNGYPCPTRQAIINRIGGK